MDDFRTNYFQAIRDMVNYSFLHYFSVKNCKILDIGVDGDLSTSKEFIKKGASQVIAVNSYEFNSDITVPNNIVYLKKGAEDVDYPDGYFDIIYGNSVLEHINGFDNFLDKMLTLLEKDGVIYLEGAPFWTCPVGHHLFVSTDDKLYTFSDNCPIKKYEHLIYDKNTMMEALATRSIPKSHIEKIVDFVYESVLLNRIKPSQIKEMIKKKGYTCFFL